MRDSKTIFDLPQNGFDFQYLWEAIRKVYDELCKEIDNFKNTECYSKEAISLRDSIKAPCELAIDFGTSIDGSQSIKNDDYNIKLTQLQYLWIYLFAYTYEYYNMYLEILKYIIEKFGNSPNLHFGQLGILSFGCGNGVDYLGAKLALKAFNNEKIGQSVKYIGVDYTDWSGVSIPFSEEDKGSKYRFGEKYDLKQYLKTQEAQNAFHESAIIVFPKSLAEFSEDVFADLKTFFKTNSANHHVFLCVCPPHYGNGKNKTLERGEELCETLYLPPALKSMDVDLRVAKRKIIIGEQEKDCGYINRAGWLKGSPLQKRFGELSCNMKKQSKGLCEKCNAFEERKFEPCPDVVCKHNSLTKRDGYPDWHDECPLCHNPKTTTKDIPCYEIYLR